ncbi:hypothetical protein C8R41DRAFT_418929 [Lentinula lateritia]|uniref:Uncharacterized protein n=1 Tax=Lentinula lateritia TaxID=40482 RepID=A0ABQ8VBT8_9AGAR|nr:hypothetical protein C8R41DRAFT_418929 [Lentinula lateritia]
MLFRLLPSSSSLSGYLRLPLMFALLCESALVVAAPLLSTSPSSTAQTTYKMGIILGFYDSRMKDWERQPNQAEHKSFFTCIRSSGSFFAVDPKEQSRYQYHNLRQFFVRLGRTWQDL